MRRAAATLGRFLVTVGLLILLFVAYQLWGTGIFTARAQNDLKHKFATQLHDNPVVTTTTTATTVPPSTSGPPSSTTTTIPPPRRRCRSWW